MKEHFNDYEERMLKMMEESAREMDEVLGDGWDDDLDDHDRELSDRMDEKLFGRIRDYEERMKKREEEKCAEVHTGAADTDAEMSEEDLEALRLGRELQERRRKEEERKAERRKWAPWKRVVAAVVVIAILGGVGVQSQGGAEKVVEKIKRTHEYKEVDQVTSSKEDMKNVMNEEDQAYEQIKEELNTDPVRILRTNDEMQYIAYEIDQDLRTAYLLYEYEGNTVSYIMNCTYTEDAWGIGFEDEKVDEYEYTGKKALINVEKYAVEDSGEEQWVATFVYQGVYYCLTGHMKQEMFEDLLKNLFFP